MPVPSTRFRALLAQLLLAVGVLLAVSVPVAQAAPPTAANAPLVWSAPAGVDSHPLDAIACPSVTECVAVDHNGGIVVSSDPTGGAHAWHGARIDGNRFLTAIACPSVTECVATDNTGAIVSSADVPGGPSTWTVAADADPSTTQYNSDNAGPTLMRGIACPSVSECVAVDAAGNDIFSTNPTGGPTAWVLAHIDTNSTHGCTTGGLPCQPPLMGVACPSVTLCAAVDMAGNLLETGSPLGTAPWGSEAPDGGATSTLWGISCPTSSFCATTDGYGDSVFTWNPANPTALHRHRLSRSVFGIWCASGTLCLASSSTGQGADDLLGSLNPGAARPAWANMAPGGVNAVACPSPTTCLAADGEGSVAVGVTVASLRSALQKAFLTPRKVPKLPTLRRRGGYTTPFASPLAGKLTVTWTVPAPRTSKLSPKPAPIVVAGGGQSFPAPARARIRITLTKAGRRLLKTAKRQTVYATATYSTSTSPVTAGRRITLTSPVRGRSRGKR